MKSIAPDLIPLYDELQKHTFADCKRHCDNIVGCCQPAYCERTRQFAAEHGVTLADTGHPTLPFMTDIGCSVQPWLRPECTEYSCTIRDNGKRAGDARWTDRYYELRRKILMARMKQRREGV